MGSSAHRQIRLSAIALAIVLALAGCAVRPIPVRFEFGIEHPAAHPAAPAPARDHVCLIERGRYRCYPAVTPG